MTVSLKMYVFSLPLSYELLIVFQILHLQRNPFYVCQCFPLAHLGDSETSIGSGTLSFGVPTPHYINPINMHPNPSFKIAYFASENFYEDTYNGPQILGATYI